MTNDHVAEPFRSIFEGMRKDAKTMAALNAHAKDCPALLTDAVKCNCSPPASKPVISSYLHTPTRSEREVRMEKGLRAILSTIDAAERTMLSIPEANTTAYALAAMKELGKIVMARRTVTL